MLEIKKISKIYNDSNVCTTALENISLSFNQSGLVFLLGKSGSGKSTLLNLCGGLDIPSSGEIVINGKSSLDFSKSDFDSYRNTCVGFVFQDYNLLDELDVEGNISIAFELQGKKPDKKTINDTLELVDLKGLNNRKINTLSGGQKQRVAIARAIIKNPDIIMADEPTGALDSETGDQIFTLLKKLSRDKLVIVVSHDRDFAEKYGDRVIELKDGHVISDKKCTDTNNSIEEKKRADFVKSKLPFKHILKISFSNFKLKPFRLALTTILSTLSFGIFGIFSTLMFYNAPYTYSKALQNAPYDSLKIDKKFAYKVKAIRTHKNGQAEESILDKTYYQKTSISKNELLSLNNNNLGLSFAGVYRNDSGSGLNFLSNLSNQNLTDFYKYSNFYGLTDCGEDLLLSNGYTKVIGNYPTSINEIAISTYTYELFQNQGYFDIDNNTQYSISKPEDLVNKNITITLFGRKRYVKSVELKITGIYNVGEAYKNKEFDILKETDTSSVSASEYKEILKDFYDCYSSSFYSLGFISPEFYNVYSPFLIADSGNDVDVNYYDFSGVSFFDSENYESYKNQPYSYNFPTEDNIVSSYLDNDVYKYANYFDVTDLDGNVIRSDGKLSDNEFYLNVSSEGFSKICKKIIDYIVDKKYAVFNRAGSIEYLNVDYSYTAPSVFIDYESLSISYSEQPGYQRIEKIILNDFGEVSYYYRTLFYDDTYTSFSENKDETHKNKVSCWYKNDGTKIGELKKVSLENFYYSYETKRIYFEDEVFHDEDFNYFLISDPNISVEKFCHSYRLDNNNEPSYLLNNNNYILGLFVDVDTGELSFTKKEGYIFTDHYYLTEDNKIIIGEEVDRVYKIKTENGDEYSYNPYNIPLGYTRPCEGNQKIKRFLYDDNEFLKSIFKYSEFVYQLRIDDYYPGFKLDESDIGFTSNDLKTILKAYKQYCNETGKDSLVDKTYAIFRSNGQIDEMTLKGFFIESEYTSNERELILSDKWKNEPAFEREEEYSWKEEKVTDFKIDDTAQYSYLLMKTNMSKSDIEYIFDKQTSTYKYFFDSKLCSNVDEVISAIQSVKNIFLVIGLVLGFLSALLLFNFISTSISNKMKEIGILRAIGARSIDVLKIYSFETAVLCFACFIFSCVLSVFGCSYLNSSFDTAVNFQIYDFRLINVVLIFGISMIISVIATFLPIYKVSKTQPVDIIRKM